eukprot:6182418-Pleurochrysis_carterae.AAC.1
MLRSGAHGFLGLNKHVRYKHHARWSPELVPYPLPAEHDMLQNLHLLSAPFIPTNLGHVIWEEAFPLLLAMAQLGIYTERPTIVRTLGCNESTKGVRLCRKFESGFVRPLQGHDAASSEAPPSALQTLRELRARVASLRRPVCFARLLVGGYHDMFNAESHAGKEPLIALYRERVLQFHGVDPAYVPTEHRALLLRKDGRRGMANVDAVFDFMRGGCDGQCDELRSRVQMMSPQLLTIREQLEAISRATIAVSPAGGVSMALPFLPQGACVILVNYQACLQQWEL